MKKLILICLLISMQSALADYYNTFETKQQAYDRRSYENYQTYQNNNYQAPLGGYNRPLGDTGGKQFGINNNNGLNNFNNNGYNNRQSSNNGMYHF